MRGGGSRLGLGWGSQGGLGCVASVGLTEHIVSCCRKWRRAILTSCSYPRTWSCPPERQGRCLPPPPTPRPAWQGSTRLLLCWGTTLDPGSAA